ncbi:PTS sugar transporter subunit IIA [Humidisolicoccus flavus]|uniref:PTS sugar transporter subunit IIA n=1 Tax=Humidisolicoccus flavus TaxID=3111414 RepID=UPI0032482897
MTADSATPIQTLPEVSFLSLEGTTDVEVLGSIADAAIAAGFVLPSFKDALLTREAAFPTALPTETPVAIPHADAEHVLRAGIGIAKLSQPVSFGLMGSESDRIDVEYVAVLLVAEAHSQVDLLVRLVSVFQTPNWSDSIAAAESPVAMAAAMNELLATTTPE